jgi:hypothetical protein
MSGPKDSDTVYISSDGGVHSDPSEAIASNINFEENAGSVTDGNCGQDPDLVSDTSNDSNDGQ